MKKIIFGFICMILFLVSCGPSYGPDHRYSWKIAVVYTNGDKDTIDVSYDSFKGNECFLYLKTHSNGVLADASMEPCIVTGCGLYHTTVVCGVRKYEILKSDTVLIPSRYSDGKPRK